MRVLLAVVITTIFSLLIYVQGVNAIPYCRTCPYDCSELGLGKKDCSFLSESRGLCCVDLSNKGIDLAHAQERAVESSRPQYGASQDHCPAGFSPSEQKCSPDERRRGCKDVRLPSGLGCVKR